MPAAVRAAALDYTPNEPTAIAERERIATAFASIAQPTGAERLSYANQTRPALLGSRRRDVSRRANLVRLARAR
jgi:hypothetical protein